MGSMYQPESLDSAISFLLGKLDQVPAAFWGVVVGSALTLIGVHLTNRANDRRLARQLEHDREARRSEREANLRKEIYLEAIEAVAAGLAYLGRLGDVDTKLPELAKRYIESNPAVAKVPIVASEKTAESFARYNSAFVSSMMKLVAARVPLENDANQGRLLMQQIDTASQEAVAFAAATNERRLTGQAQNEAIARATLEAGRLRLDQLVRDHKETIERLLPAQLAFAKQCQIEVAQLSRKLVPVVAAIREELALPFQEAIFEKILKESQEQVVVAFDELLAKLKSGNEKP